MDAHKLSQRLIRVANYVPQGARLADIGSDHAYLPAYLALQKQISFAIAGEVVKGPYENARHEILQEGLQDLVEARLADGLAAINLDDEIDTITICGMGGPLIANILEKGKDKLVNHPLLILQPNVGSKDVRLWLQTNQYELISEEILAEDGHIYEILVARFVPQRQELSADELTFGPYLLKDKNAAFIAKWQKEKEKLQKIIAQLQAAPKDYSVRIQELEQEMTKITEVIGTDD